MLQDLIIQLTTIHSKILTIATYLQYKYIKLLCVKILSFPFFPCFKRKRREAAGVKLSRNCVSFFIVSTWVSPNENMSSQMDVNCFQAEIIFLLSLANTTKKFTNGLLGPCHLLLAKNIIVNKGYKPHACRYVYHETSL